MTVEIPEGYFNIEVRDSENCWVVRMMPDGSIDINPKFTASEAGAKFVRVVREISGRMTTEVNEELVQRVALVMANKMKAAADSVNSTAWISGPNAGYGGPHEEMVTQVAMTLDGEFDLCVLARAALSTLAPSAAPSPSEFRKSRPDLDFTDHAQHAVIGMAYAIASPSAEAAQPVAWQWRFTEKGYDEWKNGRTPVNPYATFGSSWSGEIMETEERPLYALSQPQGELREALKETLRVLLQTPDRLRSNAHKNAIGKARAALAGRTAK